MGGIVNIYFKANVGAGMGQSFLPHSPGRGLFILHFEALRLKFSNYTEPETLVVISETNCSFF